jgi:UDP-N-acetyl-D-glucosamine dehydrogenase
VATARSESIPEIRLGVLDLGFSNTPKVVSGIDTASLESVKAFYDSVVETTVPMPSCKEAELTKLLENTFRHVNVALARISAQLVRGTDRRVGRARL